MSGPRVLGIESTCDETAAAIVRGRQVLSNVVASQVAKHAHFGGVVPEVAGRAHVEAIVGVVKQAMADAQVDAGQLDAIAVAHRPGLIGSLVIGTTAAKALSLVFDRPIVAVDHVKAHLHSVRIFADGEPEHDPPLPAVGLVVSGGHTSLYHVADWLDVRRIGRTIDDAVGEAYDKAAAMLGLGYPGGPIIDKLAQTGDGTSLKLPRPMLGPTSLDFSFSGLKTALLYAVFGDKGRARTLADVNQQEIADAAASFQASCVETIVKKLRRAVDQTSAKSVVLGGGVSANHGLRKAVREQLDVPAFVPAWPYCTDNAAMIAGLGARQFVSGDVAALDFLAESTVRD
ncbi:MAG: tRNA (adenosine(37)-N6)-threonylcarbamoyltransferase complex transferase subunit TsaD [Planctomycetota bacterium]